MTCKTFPILAGLALAAAAGAPPGPPLTVAEINAKYFYYSAAQVKEISADFIQEEFRAKIIKTVPLLQAMGCTTQAGQLAKLKLLFQWDSRQAGRFSASPVAACGRDSTLQQEVQKIIQGYKRSAYSFYQQWKGFAFEPLVDKYETAPLIQEKADTVWVRFAKKNSLETYAFCDSFKTAIFQSKSKTGKMKVMATYQLFQGKRLATKVWYESSEGSKGSLAMGYGPDGLPFPRKITSKASREGEKHEMHFTFENIQIK